jgi:hypothetical protein
MSGKGVRFILGKGVTGGKGVRFIFLLPLLQNGNGK